jgi:AraC-like DNA-binding protein
MHHVTRRGHVNTNVQLVCWILDYSISGLGRYRVGRGRAGPWRERPPRVAHLYPPGVRFEEDLRCVSSMIEDAYFIFWGGESTELPSLVRKPHCYARFLDPHGRLEACFIKAARAGFEREEGGFWEAQAGLCSAIDLLLQSEHAEGETYRIPMAGAPACAVSPIVSATQAWLRAHLREHMSLSDLAASLNVSVSTLSHRFRAETGVPPMMARLQMRIDLAKNLLLRGVALKNIVDETGFCDSFHLSKMFKRVTGSSPRKYMESGGGADIRAALKGQASAGLQSFRIPVPRAGGRMQ